MKPKILIVDDEKPLRDTLARWLRPSYDCLTAPDGDEAMKIVSSTPDLALMVSDIRMPGEDGVSLMRRAKAANPNLACILLTAYGTVDLAVEAMHDGADYFFQKPITDLKAFEERVAKAIRPLELANEVAALKSQINTELENFTGRSPALENVYRRIRKVAPTDATVLIEGPSGSGKELTARAIHNLSRRASGPFVAVECSALSESLLESELFGYEPGAFTGADARGRIGNLEAADGGTLFLDEIGEITPTVQVKLLRALESRTVKRVGSNVERPVNFRLIAATNKDLAALVAAGDFREDLYYRLNVIDIRTPALRDHREDIALLVSRFLKEFASVNGGAITGIEPAALKLLEDYSWPGNVRQLRNVIEKMVVLATGPKLTAEDLPFEITHERDSGNLPPARPLPLPEPAAPQAPAAPAPLPASVPGTTLADAEKAQILAALEAAGNNKSKAALALGISRRTLHRKLKEWEER